MASTVAQKNILAAKEKGNACVQRGDYQQAIIEYTKGITTTSPAERTSANSFHLLYGNRSLSHLEIFMYQEAFDDAKSAIRIDPKYAKGWLRLAQAAFHCGIDDKIVPLYLSAGVRADPSLEQSCRQYTGFFSSTNNNMLFLQGLALNNAMSLFRQLWFDCNFEEKVKDYLQEKASTSLSPGTPFRSYLQSVCPVLSPPNEGVRVAELDNDEDPNYVIFLLQEWLGMKSTEELVQHLTTILSKNVNGFALTESTLNLVRTRVKFLQQQALQVRNEPANIWFLRRTKGEEDDRQVGTSQNLNVTAARQHFSKTFAYASSGIAFAGMGDITDDELRQMRRWEEEGVMMQRDAQRTGMRTTQILIFKILLPLFENWMNEIYPTEEKRAELPKNIVDHFFNYKKIHPTASSLQSLLQYDGGVCACCLEPFIADKKTKIHYDPVECLQCASVFYCSAACRDKASREYGHKPNRKGKQRISCCSPSSRYFFIAWSEEFRRTATRNVVPRKTVKSDDSASTNSCRQNQSTSTSSPSLSNDNNNNDSRQKQSPSWSKKIRDAELISMPALCTPATVASIFEKPPGAERLPDYKKWTAAIKRCTNMAMNEKDPYGDGDQSLVRGRVPGTPGGDLLGCLTSNMDGGPHLLSVFMRWCSGGFFPGVSAALAALPDDEARRKAVNRRESLIRVCPLMCVAMGAASADGGVVSISKETDYLRTFRLLVDCGADLNARNIIGLGPVNMLALPTAHPRAIKLLIQVCDIYGDEIDFKSHNRFGQAALFENFDPSRMDSFRTMLMLGANPFRLDRNTCDLLTDPRFVDPKFYETAMKCYRNRNLRLDDLVSLHSLKNAKHLNGVIGKIVERLPEGKYAVEILDGKKKVSIAMENVIAAGECPNCDKPALLNELLCSTCRLGFCCEECLKSHDWCEDAEDATHLDVPDDCFVTLSLEKDYKRKVSMKLSDAQPVATAKKPRPNHFFLLKVDVPIKGSDLEEIDRYSTLEKKYTYQPPEKNVFLYDATHTFKYVLDKEKQKRLGGAAQAQAYDTLLAATDEYPAAFFWAVLDEAESQIKIDIKAKTPTVLW